MKCSEIEQILSDYLADNVGDDLRRRVESHVRGCGDCGAELDRMRRMIEAFGRLDRVSAPPDFLSRVRRMANEESGPRKIPKITSVPFRLKIPAQLAAMTILAGFIFLLIPYQATRHETGTRKIETGVAPETAHRGPAVERKRQMTPKAVVAEKEVSAEEKTSLPPVPAVSVDEPSRPRPAAPTPEIVLELYASAAPGAVLEDIPMGAEKIEKGAAAPEDAPGRVANGGEPGFDAAGSPKSPPAVARSKYKAFPLKEEQGRLAETGEDFSIGDKGAGEAGEKDDAREGLFFSLPRSRVEKLVERFDGTLLSRTAEPSGALYLKIRMPASRFESFSQQLETMGDLRVPSGMSGMPDEDFLEFDLVVRGQ